jgi:hypothetical protein
MFPQGFRRHILEHFVWPRRPAWTPKDDHGVTVHDLRAEQRKIWLLDQMLITGDCATKKGHSAPGRRRHAGAFISLDSMNSMNCAEFKLGGVREMMKRWIPANAFYSDALADSGNEARKVRNLSAEEKTRTSAPLQELAPEATAMPTVAP